MSQPLWQILIPSVYSRHQSLAALLDRLGPQLTPYQGAVEVLVDLDDCTIPVGKKRGWLIKRAQADYVSFVDDDDMVAPDYVERVCDALSVLPDQVGFEVAVLVDGVAAKRCYHSLRYHGWTDDTDGYYRDISHLNPIRTELARIGLPFLDGFGEDNDWAGKLRQSGRVVTEQYVAEVLYEYRYSSSRSLFAGGPRQLGRIVMPDQRPYVRLIQADAWRHAA